MFEIICILLYCGGSCFIACTIKHAIRYEIRSHILVRLFVCRKTCSVLPTTNETLMISFLSLRKRGMQLIFESVYFMFHLCARKRHYQL